MHIYSACHSRKGALAKGNAILSTPNSPACLLRQAGMHCAAAQVEPLSSHIQSSSFPTRQPSSSSPHRLLRQTLRPLPGAPLPSPLSPIVAIHQTTDEDSSRPAEPLASTILPPSQGKKRGHSDARNNSTIIGHLYVPSTYSRSFRSSFRDESPSTLVYDGRFLWKYLSHRHWSCLAKSHTC